MGHDQFRTGFLFSIHHAHHNAGGFIFGRLVWPFCSASLGRDAVTFGLCPRSVGPGIPAVYAGIFMAASAPGTAVTGPEESQPESEAWHPSRFRNRHSDCSR